jgi:uncharacterized RDD family membrane protein YckC
MFAEPMSDDTLSLPGGLTTEGLLGRRYLARFIDYVCIGLLLATMALAGRALSLPPISTVEGALAGLTVLMCVWIGYGAVLESSAWQATLGKRLLGLRVYGARGERIAFPQAVGRNLVKDGPFIVLGFVSAGHLIGIALLVAHLIVMHRSPLHHAIHDRIAATLVAAPQHTIELGIA